MALVLWFVHIRHSSNRSEWGVVIENDSRTHDLLVILDKQKEKAKQQVFEKSNSNRNEPSINYKLIVWTLMNALRFPQWQFANWIFFHFVVFLFQKATKISNNLHTIYTNKLFINR